MDKTVSACLEFPPATSLDAVAYEAAINPHLLQLTKFINDPSKPLISNGPELLKLLDPSVNSLSYLAVLHGLFLPSLTGDRELLCEKLVIFLLSFDARQIRYAGAHLLQLLNLVAKGQLLPVSKVSRVIITRWLTIL